MPLPGFLEFAPAAFAESGSRHHRMNRYTLGMATQGLSN
jgi:hypothetical protein